MSGTPAAAVDTDGAFVLNAEVASVDRHRDSVAALRPCWERFYTNQVTEHPDSGRHYVSWN